MSNIIENRHGFTSRILEILEQDYRGESLEIFNASPILGYINAKTRAANRGSKSRGSFANLYALYVIVEDYLNNGYGLKTSPDYSEYEGARFSDLLRRQRELPFGSKLQNHALNSRLNDEFRKFNPTLNKTPIVRDVTNQRYWIQEDLLLVSYRKSDGTDKVVNIAESIIQIIDAYVATRKQAFESFIESCERIAKLSESRPDEAFDFVVAQLQPNIDARIFEIVSFAVLKAKYGDESVWIGESIDDVEETPLSLYKTGRTNANDGGIDFVMKPLGRFFQVTESVDATKYFLDIDKVQRFPITFVVKSTESRVQLRNSIKDQATARFKIKSVVQAYMDAVEEIINVQALEDALRSVVESGKFRQVMDEIVLQSKVEFNFIEPILAEAEGGEV